MGAEANHPAITAIEAALRAAQITPRRLAPDQLGCVVDDLGGWPLDIGVRVEGPVVRAQAIVCGPGQIDPHVLLHDHRKRSFARFTHAACGTVWVEAELPAATVDLALADAMLGALLEAAGQGRSRAASPG